MYKEIDIGLEDGSIQKMPFKANAATPLRLKQVFNIEIWQFIHDVNVSDDAIYENMDIISELAYIMHCQGIGADMSKLNFNTYVDWLETLSGMAILENAIDILTLYISTTKTSVDSGKKTNVNPPER